MTFPATSRVIQGVLKKYSVEQPFSIQFTDQAYARKFDNEVRLGKLATVFTTLAIFISCLGIFGLSSFVAEQRTREIGIRKVMGASLYDLWKLISKDFVLLVVISCALAIPIAYHVLSGWLEHFEYRIGAPWWVFVSASAATLVITLLTVSWHTLTAASANPVRNLRTE